MLIEDCYEQVKFLNQLPLTVLEASIQSFRENIFSMAGRKQIPNLIYETIVQELANEAQDGSKADGSRVSMSELVKNQEDVRDLKQLSGRIYQSLQVVLEFMDKGVKGLLSGDMSAFLLLEI